MASNVVGNYGWDSDRGPESCGYITPRIVKILNTLRVRRICDIGSGNGSLSAALHGAGFECAGVEYDRGGFDISVERYPKINFYNLGVQDDPQVILQKEGQHFEAVVSTEVIEHLFSPHLLPQFAHPLLKKGGYLIVSTPYHGYLKNLALAVFNKWDAHHTPLWHGGHIKFWSRKTLSCLLEDNGFAVIGFYGAGRVPWLWKSMILVARAV